MTGLNLKSLYLKQGFQLIHLPIPDFDVPSKEDLEEAIKKTVEHAHAGQNILIHCHAGLGRTGLFVTWEIFDSVTSSWLQSEYPLTGNCIFVLPPWLEVWWHEFGFEAELYLGAFRKGGTIAGVAPLLLRGTEDSFVGS